MLIGSSSNDIIGRSKLCNSQVGGLSMDDIVHVGRQSAILLFDAVSCRDFNVLTMCTILFMTLAVGYTAYNLQIGIPCGRGRGPGVDWLYKHNAWRADT